MFIKILNKTEWHLGLQYHEGRVVCPDYQCNQKRSNGIHFTTAEHAWIWAGMGDHYREVLACAGFVDFGCGTEFKAQSVVLGPRCDLPLVTRR